MFKASTFIPVLSLASPEQLTFHPQIQGPIGHTAGKHKHLERGKESPSPSSPAGTRVTWTRLPQGAIWD